MCKQLTMMYFFRWVSSSYRVCNGDNPSHSSTLHFRNVVPVWSIPEMSAVRHNVAEITCGCAAHTGFALPVAPKMSAMYATAVYDHSGVVLLGGCHIAAGCSG